MDSAALYAFACIGIVATGVAAALVLAVAARALYRMKGEVQWVWEKRPGCNCPLCRDRETT